MKTLHIDDELFTEIDKLATGIFTHSDVIRKLLSQKSVPSSEIQASGAKISPPQQGSITEFVQSARYLALRKTGDRYLMVLSWINKHRPNEFKKVEDFQRGKRKYFAKNSEAILESGRGNIKAKQIQGSSFWTLVTLDSSSMRSVLTDVLHLTGFKVGEIKTVVETIQGRPGGATSVLLSGLT